MRIYLRAAIGFWSQSTGKVEESSGLWAYAPHPKEVGTISHAPASLLPQRKGQTAWVLWDGGYEPWVGFWR